MLTPYLSTTLIEHVVATVESVAADVRISVADQSTIPESVHHLALEDAVPGLGPMGGIITGFQTSSAEVLLVVAGDMPKLTESSLRSIVEKLHGSTELDAVVARDAAGRITPVVGSFRRSVVPAIQKCIVENNLAMHDFIAGIRGVAYVTLTANELTNVNRPSDLQI